MIEKLDIANPGTTLFTVADAIAWGKINELIEDTDKRLKALEKNSWCDDPKCPDHERLPGNHYHITN